MGAAMMSATEVAPPGFDYGILPIEIRTEAKAAAGRIKEHLRSAIVEVGADLIQVKGGLPHGEFGKWLKAEFGMTERSAQNYMAAAELAGKCETVSVLQPKTLYLLAAPSTPEPVRQEIIERFDAGEVVSDRTVKEMVDDAKFQALQKQRRAEEAAKIAKLSPRTRKSHAEREAEREREQQEHDRKREQSKSAAGAAAALILEAVGNRAEKLADLIRALDYDVDLGDALRIGLGLERPRW
jgi:Protein of unknown function (DUF3102)